MIDAIGVLVVDEHHALLEFELDEIAIIEYLFEVLLGVVVKLGRRTGTMMRKSSKQTPSACCSLLEKNLKSRLIFSFSLDLKILAQYFKIYRCRE